MQVSEGRPTKLALIELIGPNRSAFDDACVSFQGVRATGAEGSGI